MVEKEKSKKKKRRTRVDVGPTHYPDTPTELGDAKTLKVRRIFMRWLKFEAVARGLFLFQVVEEIASKGSKGKRPWEDDRFTKEHM